jgi:hypothetical protein
MPIKTITQIRADTPTVTLTDADLFMVDQATKTVAGSLAQLKAFVRPANATPTAAGLMTAADKIGIRQCDGWSVGADLCDRFDRHFGSD